MTQRYSFQGYDGKKMARAIGVSLPISFKEAREICHFLKNRPTEIAKKILNSVLEKKQAIPYKRFNMNVPHKPGMAAGRYPRSSSKEILKLIESVEANANSKGINSPFIIHMNSHRAPESPRSGRSPGATKRAHVEIVVAERKVEEKKQRVKAK